MGVVLGCTKSLGLTTEKMGPVPFKFMLSKHFSYQWPRVIEK